MDTLDLVTATLDPRVYGSDPKTRRARVDADIAAAAAHAPDDPDITTTTITMGLFVNPNARAMAAYLSDNNLTVESACGFTDEPNHLTTSDLARIAATGHRTAGFAGRFHGALAGDGPHTIVITTATIPVLDKLADLITKAHGGRPPATEHGPDGACVTVAWNT